MGKVRFAGGGGNGFNSEDCTAKLITDVVAGKTAITADSDDEPGTGGLPDKNDTTQEASASLDTANARVVMQIPALGRYNEKSKLITPYTSFRNLIGLTADKIVSGNSILGLAGTATGDATISDTKQLRNGVIAYGKNGAKYTGTMTERVATTITPSKSKQVISAGTYLAGDLTVAPIPSGVTMSFINAGAKNDHSTYAGRSTNFDKVYPNGSASPSKNTTLSEIKNDLCEGLTLSEIGYCYDWYMPDNSESPYTCKYNCNFWLRPVRCEDASSVTIDWKMIYKRSTSSDERYLKASLYLCYFNDDDLRIQQEHHTDGKLFWATSQATDTGTFTLALNETYKKTYKWVAPVLCINVSAPHSGNILATLYPGTGITNAYYTT